MSKKNYYDILRVKRDCTVSNIKKAYIEQSKKHHPDLNDNTKASHDAFVEVQNAYETLVDERKRRIYDRYLSEEAARKWSSHSHANSKEREFWETYRHTPSKKGGMIFRLMIIPNVLFVASLLLFASIGGYLQSYFIRKRAVNICHEMDLKSRELSMLLDQARSDYKRYGLEGQLRRKSEELLHRDLDEFMETKGSKKRKKEEESVDEDRSEKSDI